VATGLLGDSIAANLFILGYAYQKGLIPVSATALEKAIEINAVAIEMNKQAFVWGRRAARDWQAVQALAAGEQPVQDVTQTLDQLINARSDDLIAYQSKAYAQRYRRLLEQVRTIERQKMPGRTELSEAVARYFYKLMAYKDEYEVARLYSDGRFEKRLKESFEDGYQLKLHLAPPLFSKKDPETGLPVKSAYGPWILSSMKLLAGLRRLRGTALDIFGYSAERRLERQLIADYETTLDELLTELTPDNYELAVAIAALPEKIRGYGYVKERHLQQAQAERTELLAAFRNPQQRLKGAA
jgi:indolepyruvate ferredoxin oxidoreductase